MNNNWTQKKIGKELIRTMKRKNVEKIEVAKNTGNFYYTGILNQDPDDADWVIIQSTRGENLKFRKEQIMQRRVVNDTGVDTNGKGNKDIQV